MRDVPLARFSFDLSFPLRRESRFVLGRIGLDTRFRGYDDLDALCALEIMPGGLFEGEHEVGVIIMKTPSCTSW